ncbi:hypothetical protein Fmac_018806 [Flemingia macrophylla]|uniref:Uncharacterized protein n=1 Tax=Flemingia macrophylla TaxID=520843 RepID=A0ABD1M663_9FABA
MKGKVRQFLAGDESHGNTEEINAKTLKMDKEMQILYYCEFVSMQLSILILNHVAILIYVCKN